MIDGSKLLWKLQPRDRKRITCQCGAPAEYGRSPNGGAPFFYECAKHLPLRRKDFGREGYEVGA